MSANRHCDQALAGRGSDTLTILADNDGASAPPHTGRSGWGANRKFARVGFNHHAGDKTQTATQQVKDNIAFGNPVFVVDIGGGHELAIGSKDGDLPVFKLQGDLPVRACSESGTLLKGVARLGLCRLLAGVAQSNSALDIVDITNRSGGRGATGNDRDAQTYGMKDFFDHDNLK